MIRSSLLQEWPEQRERVLDDPVSALEWIKRCNSTGEYFLAIEIAEAVLKENGGTVDPGTRLALEQRLVLALSRAGFGARAKTLVEKLHVEGAKDAETLGLVGSVYKTLSGKGETPDEKSELLKKARDFYRLGFEESRGASAYCGINAAALSALLDDAEPAKRLAEATLAAESQRSPYWDMATTAEANLILGRLDQARQYYSDASHLVADNWADLASTRKQCRLLCFKLHGRRELLDNAFPAATVAFFAGHIVDAADRKQPRFPVSAIESVQERIRAWLTQNDIRFTYSSAACGADILFLETAQAVGAETHVILPFRKEDFVNTSVGLRGEEWIKRFEAVTENSYLTILNEDVPDFRATAFEFTNRMIAVRASAKAAAYDVPLRALAVWDGKQGDAPGGTADAVEYWSLARVQVDVIHPMDAQPALAYDVNKPPPQKPFPGIYTANPRGIETAMGVLLYLRFNGYESLREKGFEPFSKYLIQGMAELMTTRGWVPARFGFGGQYLFVWKKVRDAGIAAIEFMSLLTTAAKEKQINVVPSLCLHSAALQLMVNPILNQYTHEGTAISKVQTLCEALDPGIIFATEPFAEFASFEKVRDFSCEYAGTLGVSRESRRTRIYQVSK